MIFIGRYARDDALLMAAIKHHWIDILAMLDGVRRPGNVSQAIPRHDMQAALLQACDMNLMGQVSISLVVHQP